MQSYVASGQSGLICHPLSKTLFSASKNPALCLRNCKWRLLSINFSLKTIETAHILITGCQSKDVLLASNKKTAAALVTIQNSTFFFDKRAIDTDHKAIPLSIFKKIDIELPRHDKRHIPSIILELKLDQKFKATGMQWPEFFQIIF